MGIEWIRDFDAACLVMKETKHCPFCGAPETTVRKIAWQCGTKKTWKMFMPDAYEAKRSKGCYERSAEVTD